MTSLTDSTGLLGTCPCCGQPTGRLFGMGHDARFKSRLAQAYALAGPDATLDWHTGPAVSTPVTVSDALTRVREAIGKDWAEVVAKQAARRQAGTRRAQPPSADRDVPVTPPSRDWSDEKIEDLMDRLSSHPLTGQWGWYRPAAPTEAQRTVRFPARVYRTYRDQGVYGVDLLVIRPDGRRELVLDVEARLWVRDETAKV